MVTSCQDSERQRGAKKSPKLQKSIENLDTVFASLLLIHADSIPSQGFATTASSI